MGPSERSGSTVTSSETTAGRVVALAKVTATLGEFDHIIAYNIQYVRRKELDEGGQQLMVSC